MRYSSLPATRHSHQRLGRHRGSWSPLVLSGSASVISSSISATMLPVMAVRLTSGSLIADANCGKHMGSYHPLSVPVLQTKASASARFILRAPGTQSPRVSWTYSTAIDHQGIRTNPQNARRVVVVPVRMVVGRANGWTSKTQHSITARKQHIGPRIHSCA